MKKTGLTSRNRASLKRTVAIAALAVATLFFATATVKADLIANGSFEDPEIPANSKTTGGTPTSWKCAGSWCWNSSGIANGNASSGWPGSKDGNQYVWIGYSTHLYQTFTVPAGGGGQYSLTWYDNNWDAGWSYYTASILDNANNVVATTGTIGVPSDSTWRPRQILSVTLSSGSRYTLLFADQIEWLTGLDNVSLSPSPSSVPIPPTLLLLGSGLIGLVGIRRRLKK